MGYLCSDWIGTSHVGNIQIVNMAGCSLKKGMILLIILVLRSPSVVSSGTVSLSLSIFMKCVVDSLRIFIRQNPK